MHDDGSTTLGTTADERASARRVWAHLECVHVPQYFSPMVAEAHAELGLELPFGGYAAGRIAPMGPVGPEVATAVFYGFAPSLLRRALPAAWEAASPERIHQVTLAAVEATLAPALSGLEGEVARAAELAREAASEQPIVGRALAAARASAPWPDTPLLVLFEAATRIREARGDGHVAALVVEGIDGCESHLTQGGDPAKTRRILQPMRGWSDQEWEAAIDRLRTRGVLEVGGELTAAGRALRERVETRTDALTVPGWRAFGSDRTTRLLEALRPIARAIADAKLAPGVVTRRIAA